MRLDATQGITCGRGLTDDDEIVGRGEQVDQSSPNQLAIVKDEDPDGLEVSYG